MGWALGFPSVAFMTGKFHFWRKTCSGHSTFSNVEQVLLSITSRAACVPVLFEDKMRQSSMLQYGLQKDTMSSAAQFGLIPPR